MFNFLLVALGGGLGAAGRYGVSLAVPAAPGGWPWATFGINVAGSLLIGILAGWLSAKGEDGEPWRLFLGVGILGGFTTFSAFSLETLRLIESGDWVGGVSYSVVSVLAGLAAVTAGMFLSRAVLA